MIARPLSGWLRRAWASPPAPPPRGSRLLAVLSRLYGLGISLRRARAVHAPIPVVSVGSIWAGGTGKTPLASALALHARAEGRKPAIVLRGYRGTVRHGVERVEVPLRRGAVRRFGDEACWHAQTQAGPVYVARKRIAGVLRAAEEGCDLAILDDGMQHRSLARDLEIVSLPAEAPCGNGRLLPRGPLREAPTALARADLIVLAYAGGSGVHAATRLRLAGLAPNAAVLVWRAGLRLRPFHRGDHAPEAPRAGSPVGLLCGLGNPDLFRRSVQDAGCLVAWVEAFPDHHTYRKGEVEGVLDRAASDGLGAVVTTEKDAIRMAADLPAHRVGLFVAGLEMHWIDADAEQALRAKLRTCLQR